MTKLKRMFSLVLVLVLLVSNTAFAKSLIEVMKEKKDRGKCRRNRGKCFKFIRTRNW